MNQVTPLSGCASAQWLNDLDPRVGLILVLLTALCLVSASQLVTVILACLIVVVVLGFARLPLAPLLKRILAFEGFIAVFVLLLPFTSVAQDPAGILFGILPYYQQGIDQALFMFFRANAIVLLTLILVATKEPEDIGYAFARLGMPDKLVQLFLMTTRYVSLIAQEYRRLRNAMRARAFQPSSSLHSWRSYGWLLGMLLVRSLERSGRVLDAMRCRGYQGQYYVLNPSHWRIQDTIALIIGMLVIVVLFSMDLFGVDLYGMNLFDTDAFKQGNAS